MIKDPNLDFQKFKKNPRMVLWWMYARLTTKRRALPEFIIAGTVKGGTTSLFQYLAEHPNVYPPLRKEIKYFDSNYFLGAKWYQSHFPLRGRLEQKHAITGEASPGYMAHPTAMQRIALKFPKIKIIVLLRNPIERAFSHYHHSLRAGEEQLSFEEAIEQEPVRMQNELEKIAADYFYPQSNFIRHNYLSRGHYTDQVQTIFSLFPQEEVLVIKSEDFYEDPGSIYRQVVKFLGLPAWEPEKYKVFNRGSYQANIPDDLRKKLVDYFRPYNQKLYELLGRDFGWDKK